MAFFVDSGSPKTIMAPIDITTATNLFVGQLVMNCTGSMNGVGPLAAASGAVDKSGLQSIYGVVVGDNRYDSLFDATYGQYIAGAGTVAAQTGVKKLSNMGMWAKGDPAPMVQVAKLCPSSVIRANIYNATVGTAPTVVTATAVNATMGLGFTTGSIDVATVANMCTAYCRTGANAGLYRTVKSASATTHTFDEYWPFTLAIGDTFVFVPMRVGSSFVQITSTAGYLGMGFNCAATAATNYFQIDVLELDLREAGKETVLFTFDPAHYSSRPLS